MPTACLFSFSVDDTPVEIELAGPEIASHLTSLSFYSLECQVCNRIKDVIIRTQMQSFVIDGQQLEYMKLNFLPK